MGLFLLFFCWERMTFKGPAVLSSRGRKNRPVLQMGKKRQDADRLGVIGIAQDLLARFESLSVLPFFPKRLCYPPVETRENFFFFPAVCRFSSFPK
jgi:hypothetical protein